jgi:hypothetical protein
MPVGPRVVLCPKGQSLPPIAVETSAISVVQPPLSLTGLTYTLGMTTLGTLTYGYDANGRRTSMGGTLATVNLTGWG